MYHDNNEPDGLKYYLSVGSTPFADDSKKFELTTITEIIELHNLNLKLNNVSILPIFIMRRISYIFYSYRYFIGNLFDNYKQPDMICLIAQINYNRLDQLINSNKNFAHTKLCSHCRNILPH